jgi:hypothetical protein
MPDLKLAKLPDRNPVKITITVRPELNAVLRAYAEFYRKSYGEEETVAELIPYMLQTFLESDRGFSKAVKDKEGGETPVSSLRRPRRPNGGGENTTKP